MERIVSKVMECETKYERVGIYKYPSTMGIYLLGRTTYKGVSVKAHEVIYNNRKVWAGIGLDGKPAYILYDNLRFLLDQSAVQEAVDKFMKREPDKGLTTGSGMPIENSTSPTTPIFSSGSHGVPVPKYIEDAIKFSGVIKRSGDERLHTDFIRIPRILRYDWYDTVNNGVYFCRYSFVYRNNKEATKILGDLVGSLEFQEAFFKFLDEAAPGFTDPNSIVPIPASFLASVYEVLRALGWIGTEEQKEKIGNFMKIYGAADGFTPICIGASIYFRSHISGKWERTIAY